MLSKTFTTLSVLALGLLSVASPTETPTGHTGVEFVAATSNSTSKAPHPDIIYPNYNAVITCPLEACGGSCQITPLEYVSPYVCEFPQTYRSIEAWQVTPGQLGYGIFAALQGCALPTLLPHTETCYNVLYNGVSYPFSTFIIN